MLLLAVTALMMPALFQLVHGGSLPRVGDELVHFGSDLETLSLGVALVLIASYAAGMVFSLETHRFLTQDGESNWFEGVQLLALYAIFGLVFLLA